MANIELKYQFRVTADGDIKIINRKEFVKQMKEVFAGKTVIGEFRLPKKNRTSKQNSFYYAVTIPEITEALVQIGYDPYMLNSRVVNQYLEGKFLKVDIPSSEYAGEFITITKESKDLNTVEWMKYTEDITIWAAEYLKVVLSIPLEQKEIDLL